MAYELGQEHRIGDHTAVIDRNTMSGGLTGLNVFPRSHIMMPFIRSIKVHGSSITQYRARDDQKNMAP